MTSGLKNQIAACSRYARTYSCACSRRYLLPTDNERRGPMSLFESHRPVGLDLLYSSCCKAVPDGEVTQLGKSIAILPRFLDDVHLFQVNLLDPITFVI